jgi:hypothetical protein
MLPTSLVSSTMYNFNKLVAMTFESCRDSLSKSPQQSSQHQTQKKTDISKNSDCTPEKSQTPAKLFASFDGHELSTVEPSLQVEIAGQKSRSLETCYKSLDSDKSDDSKLWDLSDLFRNSSKRLTDESNQASNRVVEDRPSKRLRITDRTRSPSLAVSGKSGSDGLDGQSLSHERDREAIQGRQLLKSTRSNHTFPDSKAKSIDVRENIVSDSLENQLDEFSSWVRHNIAYN